MQKVQKLHEEYYKNLDKGNRRTKLRDGPCSWTGRTNVIMKSVLPKLIHRFNIIPIKVTESYVIDTNTLILKFIHGEAKKENSQLILEKNKAGELTIPDCKTNSKAKLIMTMWKWRMKGQRQQWNQSKSQEIDQHIFS